MPMDGDASASETYAGYAQRHGIRSAPLLTIVDFETAVLIAERLEPRIRDKVVVEIGGGLGLAAVAMGAFARRVYCIDANPLWAHGFTQLLLQRKPKNVSYLFGAAAEFMDYIRADVAVLLTHSDVAGMMATAARFAPETIDVYGEMIAESPSAFDPWAQQARKFA